MKTNYDALLELNEYLARQCIKADGLVKTYPKKAAVLYGRAMKTFLAVICADSDIAFDRPGDLNPINMIGVAYSCGVISRYEKEVLDDVRYAAYLAENPDPGRAELDTRMLIDKVIRFFGMVMRYYHLENEQYKEDLLPVQGYVPVSILKSFELDTPYEKVYMAADKEGNGAIIAQYARHMSGMADEAHAALESGALKHNLAGTKIPLKPEIVPYQKGNDLICVRTKIPKGYVSLVPDDFLNLYVKDRLRFIMNMARYLSSMHTAKTPYALGGFYPEDIYLSYSGMRIVFTGLESKNILPVSISEGIYEDTKSFALLTAALFPEYETVPVAGLLIKHVLMGSERSDMERIYAALKKETGHMTFPLRQLSEELGEAASERYRRLSEGDLGERPKEEKISLEGVNFDEMYQKVFS